MNGRFFFSSESVTEGHPDKIADRISDAILDATLEQDPDSRVAVESFVTTGLAFIGGEITTKAVVEFPAIIRNTIRDIGYTDPHCGFHWENCSVVTSIHKQSPDIALGVDRDGAGDQGIMFGYACRDTDVYMPLPIMLAHKLVERLAFVRKEKIVDFLRPDGKSQVTIEYNDSTPVRVDAVVLSAQHAPDVSYETLCDELKREVIFKVIPEEMMDEDTKFYINPTGRFVIGGPMADTGLTGRKTIVDTYGGSARNGGGCFSGKDPTKVDRSASYMARYIAKNLVAARVVDRVELQLAYAIGVSEPVSVAVDTFGTGKLPDEEITRIIRKEFPLAPKEMIEYLKLKRPIYTKTSSYGHFGRELPEFTWERTDRIKDLEKYL
ncbi:MAG: methionine adenosyltransferase [candidate division Zixibacteria bacterium 4484_93]|nr:MAG: methionine adenosyltransferase [candidate division Zixibacteria bacterium 4484_93]